MSKGILSVVQGPTKGLIFNLDKGTRAVLGRDPETKFHLNAAGVSRKHFCVYWLNDYVYIKDLLSTNGTYLNKNKITTSTQLNNGDLISVGFYTQLVFTIVE